MIEFRDVRKVFSGDVVAVNGISFTVRQGEVTCLIGTSGCGKTTTLKMINRLVEPTSGEILINGESVNTADPIALRRSIGYVIQRGGLMPHLTVCENIGLLEEIKGAPETERRKRIDELLELVGMPPSRFADRYPAELSGGQQQRVGIARALMADPPVLLMDEPFAALDPITRSRLHREFMEINARLKKTIIMVTHDLAEAFLLGSEIILMSRGEITQIGTKEDFLDRPANEFAAMFVASQMEGLR